LKRATLPFSPPISAVRAVGAAQGGKMPRAKARIWAKYLGQQPKKAREIARRRIERWLKEEIEEIG